MSVEKVAILDAGAQYGKVIDRRVRELSVFSDILPVNTPLEKLLKANYKLVSEKILLTFQLMNKFFGGQVIEGDTREDGIANDEKRLYGVQFHPEVDLSACGAQILRNFLFGVCDLKGDFKMNDRVEICTAKIREAVGQNKILILLSGGVDSTVCAALLSKTLDPSQIIAVHIDNGFLRKGESAEVIESVESLGIKGLRFLSGTTMIHVEVMTEALAPASVSPTKTQTDSVVSTGMSEEASDPSAKEYRSTLDCPAHGSPGGASGAKRQSHLSGGGMHPHKELRNIPIGPLRTATIFPEDKRQIIGDTFIRVAQEVWSELQLDPSSLILCQGVFSLHRISRVKCFSCGDNKVTQQSDGVSFKQL
ncbi:unnamed protein product [Trichobilharzia regenti]|nr:unnamed protein product [Trichobilharzia regenti]